MGRGTDRRENGGSSALVVKTFKNSQIKVWTRFRADLHSGVSADPYLAFFTTASATGTFRFMWFEDGGKTYMKTATMEVIG